MTARTRSPTRCAGPGSGRRSRSGSGAGGLRTRLWGFWESSRPVPSTSRSRLTHPPRGSGPSSRSEHRHAIDCGSPDWPLAVADAGSSRWATSPTTWIVNCDRPGGRIVRFVPRASGATASKAARARASDRLSGRRRGLRYLHIGEFGPPQGRGCPTPEPRQSPDLSDAIPVPARRLQGRPVDRTAALRRQPGPDPLSPVHRGCSSRPARPRNWPSPPGIPV